MPTAECRALKTTVATVNALEFGTVHACPTSHDETQGVCRACAVGASVVNGECTCDSPDEYYDADAYACLSCPEGRFKARASRRGLDANERMLSACFTVQCCGCQTHLRWPNAYLWIVKVLRVARRFWMFVVCGGDGTSCTGCMDKSACNFDSAAIKHDADACTYPETDGETRDGACSTGTDCDGSCKGSAKFDACGTCVQVSSIMGAVTLKNSRIATTNVSCRMF